MRCTVPCLLLLLTPLAAVADERLPAYLLQLPQSITDVFVADAGSAALHRYSNSPDGIRLAGTSYMSIGENGVGKRREWDRRTPLGIYFVVDRLDTSRMHEKYGVVAFPLDYPNVRDRQAARSGNGIWVHGVDPQGGRRPEYDTDGCLAVPNEDLSRLAGAFRPAATPVIITANLRRVDAADRERIVAELREAMAAWAHALAAPDPDAYLAYYADDFRYRGLERDEWELLRRERFAGRGAAEVAMGDLMLLAEPEEPGVYLARFRLRTAANGASIETVKRLYWRRDGAGYLRIVAEDNG